MNSYAIISAMVLCLIIAVLGEGTAIEKKLEEIISLLMQIRSGQYFHDIDK